jgi:hypothetical protein
MNAPGLPSILPLLERLQRPPLRFAAQTTAPIAGEGRRRCARLPFGAFSIMAVRISVNTSFSVATPAFATGHWGFPSPTTRFLDLASPVEASWVSREAGGAGSAPRKQSIWRLPSAPPVFLPSRGERGFSAPRQSLGQGPGPTGSFPQQRHRQRCRSGTVALPDTRCAPGSREGDGCIMPEGQRGVDKTILAISGKAFKSLGRIFGGRQNRRETGDFVHPNASSAPGLRDGLRPAPLKG